MDSHTLLTVWLLSSLGLCSSQSNNVLEGPLIKAVGENATFKLTTPPSTPSEYINWNFKGVGGDIPIISGVQTNPVYRDRVSVDKSTASLELRNLTINDTGEYILSIPLGVEKGRTSLTVLERISGANITTLPDVLIAGRSSVNLTCDAAQGSSITREWTKDGNLLSTSNRVTISAGNRTVSISPVEKHDNGEYTCKLSNLISNMEAKRTLIVYYGPEKPHIEGEGAIEFGHKITLTCSAESIPESSYRWAINGTDTSVTGASYIKEQSEHKDSGIYTCTALNHITGNTNTTDFELSIEDRIAGAVITHTGENLIAGKSSVILSCEARGSSITREWAKDGNPLPPNNRVIFSPDNRTVSISPVEKEDNGEYKCKLGNPINIEEAKQTLTVNYGPEKPRIDGKEAIEIGSPIHLMCSAESIPESNYTWTFKEKEISGASYSKTQSEYEDSGNYTCTAVNSITGNTITAVFELSVKAEGVNNGLPTGAIVGIVIAVIIILVSVIGLTLFLLKKKRKPDTPKPDQARDQSNGSVELNYTDISQFQKTDGQRVNLGNSGAGQMVYSEVNSGPSSSQGPTYADLQFPNKGFGLRAHTGDQNTEYAGVRPKGQAPRPPYQIPDVTYAQLRK